AQACSSIAERLGVRVVEKKLNVQADPYARGASSGWRDGFEWPLRASIAIDAGGAVGARLAQEPLGEARVVQPTSLGAGRQRRLEPLVHCVADALDAGEVYGRTVWRVDIGTPYAYDVSGAARRPRHEFFASREVTVPLDPNEREALARAFAREFARECGAPD